MTKIDKQNLPSYLVMESGHENNFALQEQAYFYLNATETAEDLTSYQSAHPQFNGIPGYNRVDRRILFLGKEEKQAQHKSSPGSLYNQLNGLVIKHFESDQNLNELTPYEIELAQDIARYLRNTASLEEQTPADTLDNTPFDEKLSAYYSTPTMDQAGFSVNLENLDFNSVNTTQYLVASDHKRAEQLIAEFKAFKQLQRELDDPDFYIFLMSVSDVCDAMFVDLSSHGAISDEILKTREELEKIRVDAAESNEDETLKKLAALKWNKKPILIAVSDYVKTKQKELQLSYSQLIYDAGMVPAKDDLPENLRYRAKFPFATKEQQELYEKLVGKTSKHKTRLSSVELQTPPALRNEWGENTEPYPLNIEIPITIAASGSSGAVPENAGDILEKYHTRLKYEFAPEWDKLVTDFQGDPISQLSARSHQQKTPSTADQKTHAMQNGTYLIADATKERAFQILTDQSDKLADIRSIDNIYGLQFTHSTEWDDLEKDLKTKANLNTIQTWLEPLVDHSQSLQDISSIVYNLYDNIYYYLIMRYELGDLHTLLSKNYFALEQLFSRLPHSEKDQTDRLHKVWQYAMKDIGGVLQSHEDAMIKASKGCLPEYPQHYKKAIHLTQSFTQSSDLSVLTGISTQIKDIDQILQKAASISSFPRNYQDALNQWGPYQDTKKELKAIVERKPQSSNLNANIILFLENNLNDIQFKRAIKPIIEKMPTEELRVYLDALKSKNEELESNSLDHIWPWQAEVFLNRLRLAIYLCDLQVRRIDEKNKDHDIPMQDYIANKLSPWFESLPSGYPNANGISKDFGVVDERYHPSGDYYLTKDELQGALLNTMSEKQSDEEARANLQHFIRFFNDYDNGYYRFFCLTNFVPDSTGRTIEVIRDQDVLNRFLVVLEKISEEASYRIVHSQNESEKQNYARLRDFCDIARSSISDFLAKQPKSKKWITKDRPDHITGAVPHRVYSINPEQKYTSPEQATLVQARQSTLSFENNPLAIYDGLISQHTAAHWYANLDNNEDYIPPKTEVVTLENILPILPNAKNEAYKTKLVKQSWLAETLYLLGRLSEREDGAFTQDSRARYQTIKTELSKIDILDLKLVVQKARLGVLPSKIGELVLTPAESLWVTGYISTQLLATKRQKSVNGGDAVFIESKRQGEVDQFIFTLTKEEVTCIRQSLFERLNIDDRSLRKLDGLSANLIATQTFNLFNNPETLEKRNKQDAVYASFEPSSESYPFKGDEAIFATAQLAHELYGSLTPHDLTVLLNKLKSDNPQFSESRVSKYLDSLTHDEKIVFYSYNRDNLFDFYEKAVKFWLANSGFLPSTNDMSRFWSFVDQIIANPDAYEEKDTDTLVPIVNSILSPLILEGESVLSSQVCLNLEVGLDHIIGNLESSDAKESKSIKQRITLLKAIKNIILENYNKSDPDQVASHSIYNPHFYFSPRSNKAKLSAEDIFTLFYFQNEILASNGWPTILDIQEQRAIESIFIGIQYLLSDHTPTYSTTINDTVVFYANGNTTVVIDDNPILISENGKVPEKWQTGYEPKTRAALEQVFNELLKDKTASYSCKQGCHLSDVEISHILNQELKEKAAASLMREKDDALSLYWKDQEALAKVMAYYPELSKHVGLTENGGSKSIQEKLVKVHEELTEKQSALAALSQMEKVKK